MPISKSFTRISKSEKWSDLTANANDLLTIHNSSEYYDMISEMFTSIEIWKTDYMHVMSSQYSILEMIRSTGLKPYLEKLKSDKDKMDFEHLVLKDIELDYPEQKDGKVLFPFKRLFIIARK